ncbi:MAG: hypothetical protein JWO74_4303 [Solirubrobacterales bacterium]|nr:hypothetical protein [Solirubrobacterales bacterium]
MSVIIVAGALANKHGNGGEAWVRLTWALGLRRLGHEVVLVEQVDEVGAASRAWFETVATRFGMGSDACLVHGDGPVTTGLALDELLARADGAALLVNLSGHLTLPEVLERVAIRLYVDLDPGYTQLWAAAGNRGARLDGHDAFATVGTNIGGAGCPLPTAGVPWIPVLTPVLLDAWPAGPPPVGGAFTTVASWRNALGTIEHEGRTYGSKAHGFRRIVQLPRYVDARFELALDVHPADRADRRSLERHGWALADPRSVAGSPEAFRDYLRGSLAECSAAQPLYAGTRSGWFSDRTAHYLASGRPALIEDTGLGEQLPLGQGLLTFQTIEEAAAGAAAILAEPERHGRAARAFAERHLDSDVVLGGLLRELGIGP